MFAHGSHPTFRVFRPELAEYDVKDEDNGPTSPIGRTHIETCMTLSIKLNVTSKTETHSPLAHSESFLRTGSLSSFLHFDAFVSILVNHVM